MNFKFEIQYVTTHKLYVTSNTPNNHMKSCKFQVEHIDKIHKGMWLDIGKIYISKLVFGLLLFKLPFL